MAASDQRLYRDNQIPACIPLAVGRCSRGIPKFFSPISSGASSRHLTRRQVARSFFYFFGFMYLLSISDNSAMVNGLDRLAVKPYLPGVFNTESSE